jgi:hypothetical protein
MEVIGEEEMCKQSFSLCSGLYELCYSGSLATEFKAIGNPFLGVNWNARCRACCALSSSHRSQLMIAVLDVWSYRKLEPRPF